MGRGYLGDGTPQSVPGHRGDRMSWQWGHGGITGTKVGAGATTGLGATVRGTQRPPCQGYGLGTEVTALGSPHELGAAHPPPLAGRDPGAVALGWLGGGQGRSQGLTSLMAMAQLWERGMRRTAGVGAPPTPWHCHPCPCHPPALPPPLAQGTPEALRVGWDFGRGLRGSLPWAWSIPGCHGNPRDPLGCCQDDQR